MPGPDPWSLGLQGAGLLGGLLSGQGAATKSKELMGLQRGYARRQLNQYDQLQPQYMQALEHYANMIGASNSKGLSGYGDVHVSPHMAARLGIDPNTTFKSPNTPGPENGYLMGPYAQQSYRLRMAAAEEALNDQTRNQDNNLMFNLGQRGIATGTQAAALARSHEDALRGYAQYVRGLAINAGPAQEQQQQQYLAMLQGGMGAGGQGAGILGQQAGVYGQQAAQGFGAAGQIAGNFVQNRAMQQYLQAMYPQPAATNQAGGAGYEPTDEYAQSYLYGNPVQYGPPLPKGYQF